MQCMPLVRPRHDALTEQIYGYFFCVAGWRLRVEQNAPRKDLYHIMDVLYAGKHGGRCDQVHKYTLARKRGSATACICDNAFKYEYLNFELWLR